MVEKGDVFHLSLLPPCIRGFISHRRSLIPLLDHSCLFGVKGEGRRCLILRSSHGPLAIEAERIVSIGQCPPMLPPDLPHTKGRVRIGEGTYRVVDLESLTGAIIAPFEETPDGSGEV